MRTLATHGLLFTLALAACSNDPAAKDDKGADTDATTDTDTAADTDDTSVDTDEPVACSGMMFDKYGETAFLAVNDAIIAKAVAAPTTEVGTSFQDLAAEGDERVAAFTTNLANFLVLVYGGPDNYDGPDMATAHAGLSITSEQYDYFVANVIVPALSESGVAMDDITDCFAPPVVDPAFKATIVGQ